MLNLLKGNGHPLADAQRAAEILGALPNDTQQAFAELAELYDSVRGDQSLRPAERLNATLAIDAAAQRYVRRLQRDYMAGREQPMHENRIWRVGQRYWSEAVAAYRACIEAIDARSLALVPSIRLLRVIGGLQRWNSLRYLTLEPDLWRCVGKLYALGERGRVSKQVVAPFPKVASETTLEREFMRILGFALAIPSALMPSEIEVAGYLAGTIARDIRIEPTQPHEATFWIDLAGGEPPARRVSRLEPKASLRFLVTSGASERLAALLGETVVEGRIPESAQLPEHCDAETVVATIRHLSAHLSATPPLRRQGRAKLKEPLESALGFDAAITQLGGIPPVSDDLDFSGRGPTAEWTTENVSVGGFEASLQRADLRAIPIRSLIAVRPGRASD